MIVAEWQGYIPESRWEELKVKIAKLNKRAHDADSKKRDAVMTKTYDQYEKLLNCLDELGWKWSSGDVIRFGMHYYMDYKDKTYVALYKDKTIAYGGSISSSYYNL